MSDKEYSFKPGQTYPSGAKQKKEGVNFSIFSRHATQVELLLFKTSQSKNPFQIIHLDERSHKTFFSWHVFVMDLPAGTWYTWRLDGPNEPKEAGLHFDKEKQLIDPWARIVSDINWDRQAACSSGDNQATAMRCMVSNEDNYDWENDKPLRITSEKSIIYEMHVGGYTNHPSSKVKNPGTFSGVVEKIPYLKKLGITHVELLPVMAFDEQDIPQGTADLGLKNYWGYSTHSFFSPHPGFCVTPEQGTHIEEFRDMVKALHNAGIGIILDVVYNHTSEAGSNGPIINFRGIGENIFYHHEKDDKSILHDYTGCGNTVNANHPLVSSFIVSSLEYWVREMHVDGFRFDLASALARGEGGVVLEDPPVLWAIELSEQLAQTKLIAEAWDAAGLYQVGSFPGHRWAEWNGKYRDVIREVLRGDNGKIQELATRISGSSDLYQHQAGLPINSINFITCHDGFTLNDLFSYNEKHNGANGEDSRDGCNNNLSYNCGEEGETNDPKITKHRRKQVKNAFAILLLSEGVPMLLAGDEILNSQQGNNNGYCQDNELTWINWEMAQKNSDILRFVQQMIALRKRHGSIMRRRFLTGKMVEERGIKDINWHGAKLDKPLWNDPETRLLALTLAGTTVNEADIHVVINMSDQKTTVELPVIKDKTWCLAVDTSEQSPADIISPHNQKSINKKTYQVNKKTVVAFENR
ncbi:MAG: glycogen debranching protein GlgX [Methylococcales symbiont of Hymedesmia sp. n. MRB-2018]|nr:MAG: glycogen debranching protein GlgX [Methylococcales symbiont of Hymedesmia sp. n. MRB-2018]KAF3984369.1 MAG: glycogen debranching protein GlgX [Methylococcales symbiont of Hymedesmia sp. n. MRB-2018]